MERIIKHITALKMVTVYVPAHYHSEENQSYPLLGRDYLLYHHSSMTLLDNNSTML